MSYALLYTDRIEINFNDTLNEGFNGLEAHYGKHVLDGWIKLLASDEGLQSWLKRPPKNLDRKQLEKALDPTLYTYSGSIQSDEMPLDVSVSNLQEPQFSLRQILQNPQNYDLSKVKEIPRFEQGLNSKSEPLIGVKFSPRDKENYENIAVKLCNEICISFNEEKPNKVPKDDEVIGAVEKDEDGNTKYVKFRKVEDSEIVSYPDISPNSLYVLVAYDRNPDLKIYTCFILKEETLRNKFKHYKYMPYSETAVDFNTYYNITYYTFSDKTWYVGSDNAYNLLTCDKYEKLDENSVREYLITYKEERKPGDVKFEDLLKLSDEQIKISIREFLLDHLKVAFTSEGFPEKIKEYLADHFHVLYKMPLKKYMLETEEVKNYKIAIRNLKSLKELAQENFSDFIIVANRMLGASFSENDLKEIFLYSEDYKNIIEPLINELINKDEEFIIKLKNYIENFKGDISTFIICIHKILKKPISEENLKKIFLLDEDSASTKEYKDIILPLLSSLSNKSYDELLNLKKMAEKEAIFTEEDQELIKAFALSIDSSFMNPSTENIIKESFNRTKFLGQLFNTIKRVKLQ